MNRNLILILVFSALFPATHMLMSHGRLREGLVRAFGGEWRFRGLYTLVSFLTLGPAVAIWSLNRQLGPRLWELPFWLERAIALPLMLLAVVLFVMMLAAPSPASMRPGANVARGILSTTRHPMNMAFAAFGLTHVAANGFLGDVFFFGQFAVLGLVGAFHQDARLARDRGERYRNFMATTSVLPFAAILQGRNRVAADRRSLTMLLIALAVFAALMVFHERLFGVAAFRWRG
jgi:uncharacterized membrane protein